MKGFARAKAHLDALGIDAMKSLRPSLHRIEAICALLDHPERAVPALHITGTNGKTSVARIATSGLSAAGLSVGTYTSPHLQDVTERIALDGAPISQDEFGEAFDHLHPYLELVESDLGERLSYFEVLTALFFLWAAEKPVDALVVEVGLGGRWDATNVVPASVAVVANIGLDHTGLLGDDRRAIAAEKAGIIKPHSAVVTGERSPDIVDILETEARGCGAELSLLGRDFSLSDDRVAFGGRFVSLATSSRSYDSLFLPLHGSHQAVNAACATEAVARFLARPLDDDVVNEGFVRATAPGRMETIRSEGSPTVVLDVAHNPDGMSALVGALLEAFAFERAAVVFGALSDKDYEGMLAEIARLPCTLVATQARSERAVSCETIAKVAEALGISSACVASVPAATTAAVASASSDGGLVVVTGSHYVVGEARTHLLG